MEPLFELIGYQAPTVLMEDGEDDYEPDDPAYITPPKPEVHHHWWRPYMRTDIEMTWVCDCGETKTDLSQREYIDLWQRHSADMLLALEGAIASPTGQLVQDYWRRVSIETDILRYIVPNIPDFLPAQKPPNPSAIEEEIPTKNEHPSPPPKAETLKSGYIEEKIIKKNGKVAGVYLYERYREGGKLKSKYLGRKKGT